MNWQAILLLLMAIGSEITATTALKFSEGFTRMGPSAVVVIGYGVSFYLLSLVLRLGVPMGIAYAIWAGLGTVGITCLAILIGDQIFNLWTLLGIGLVVSGVVLINLTANPH